MNRVFVSRRRVASQQGAVVVQAAIAMVTLLGLSVFVVDYGILWLSRQQAQNAADAGAVAAAVARAYDDLNSAPSETGIVGKSAEEMVNRNPVWFAPASHVLSFACPPELGVSVPCARVDVYRDGTFSSTPIPTFFGPVLGITSQGVRATATAQVAVGNSTPCLKPWAIPDRWTEHRPIDKSWAPGDAFERYLEPGGSLLVPADEYVAPDEGSAGSGLMFPAELGLPLTLTFADPEANAPITPGMLLPVTLPGSNSYDQNISGCNNHLSLVSEQFPTESAGVLGDTVAGFAALIAADSLAIFHPGTNSVLNSCAPGPCGSISPRLVALALFDVDHYQLMRATVPCPGVGRCVKVANIVGFFIESSTGSDAFGYVTRYPGLVSPGSPSLSTASSFLPAVTLVR